MGNSLGNKKTVKIMKISGESFKLKTPVKAGTVVQDFPGYVLLDSEAVKHFGIRTNPLEPHQYLETKKLYFMVDLPRTWKEGVPRRVKSGIEMSAKERLENLKLSRRSASDLSAAVSSTVKLKIPKWQVQKLMKESENGEDFSHKITTLCLLNFPNDFIHNKQQQQHSLSISNGGGRSFGIRQETVTKLN